MSIELLERAVEAGRLRHAALPAAVRRAHGVVATPAELARWAVSQVDTRLRSELECSQGLADSRVALLDPALGTGIWLAAALERMLSLSTANQAVAPSVALSQERTVSVKPGPHMLGFDIDDDAISRARQLLTPSSQRANATFVLSHANMLTLADPWGTALQDHVRVIVGNPPWSARSRSRGLTLSDQWLTEFRSDADGVSLGERRSGVLSDDYVRFFRWALEQARTSRAGALLCLATNSSYLDGPVHRGMRAALVNAFDHIEILDLGGNALCGGNGTTDENLFGVRVGTCVTLAVRTAKAGLRQARIAYTKLTGTRLDKLSALASHDLPAFTPCQANEPAFRFVPARTESLRPRLGLSYFSLAEAFPFHREGVQTNRDALVTDHDPERLLGRLRRFAAGEPQLSASAHVSDPASRATLRDSLAANTQTTIRPLAYRPLDDRFYFRLAPLCHRPRSELAEAIDRSALCLLSARKDRGAGVWNLFGVTRNHADACYLSTRSSCRTRAFPSHDVAGTPNVDPRLLADLSVLADRPVTSAELLTYCVGMFASHSYRRDHDAELHLDYPRLPRPRDGAMFERHLAAGQAWIDGWLAPAQDAQQAAEVFASHVLTYDPNRLIAGWGEHVLQAITPEMWRFQVGDFAVLAQIGRSRARTLREVQGIVSRVRSCVQAAAQADLAYVASISK